MATCASTVRVEPMIPSLVNKQTLDQGADISCATIIDLLRQRALQTPDAPAFFILEAEEGGLATRQLACLS